MENEVKGFFKNQNKTVLTWAVSVLLFSLSAAVLMYVCNKGKESNSYLPAKYHVAEGVARMNIAPDFAEIGLNLVSTSSVSMEEAKSFNEERINEIRKSLEGKSGVEVLKTSSYTSYPEDNSMYTGMGDSYYTESDYSKEPVFIEKPEAKVYAYTGYFTFKINNLSDVDGVEFLLKSKIKSGPEGYVIYPIYKLKNPEVKFRELSAESLRVTRMNGESSAKVAGLSLGKPYAVYVGEYYVDSTNGQVSNQTIARDFFSYMDKGGREYELKTSITYEVK